MGKRVDNLLETLGYICAGAYLMYKLVGFINDGTLQKYFPKSNTPRYSGVENLTPEMKAIVDQLEDKIGKVTITSGARDGIGSSAHNAGLAVDIRAWDGKTKYAIVNAALELGIKRVGIYDRHVHIDIDSTKTHQNTIWLGKSK